MEKSLQALLEYVAKHSNLPAQDKDLQRLSKKLNRELEKARFKEDRARREKQAISVLLEETIRELETRNEETNQINTRLLVAEEELKQNEEELKQSAERLQEANINLEARIQARTQEIELKNHRITSSINYAKRIQQATLPNLAQFHEVFKGSFVYYKPRDIVSGDFYFFEAVKTPTGLKYIIAAVDGTGHGVPGAFISLIGRNLLHEITAVRRITDAKKIMEALNVGTIEALHQEDNNNQDGMDAALCVVDTRAQTLEFVGAKNPLVYVQNGELHHIKGTKLSVGGTLEASNKSFQVHKIAISQPTTCYMYTDGFQDQFGGTREKKFMAKRFRQLLFELHHLPMEKQKAQLYQTLQDWMNPTPQQIHPQVDDILVMGFQL